jgi:hypothetical protein
MRVIKHFAPVFSERIWDWVQVLVCGAILAPTQRTVASILRVMGLAQERTFQNYHRVFNRARWQSLQLSRILLGLILTALVPPDAIIELVADEILERRRGKKIAAKGHFRDPVRSSEKRNVTSEGLRWITLAVLVKVPWSQRLWALPFMTVLAPHEKTNLVMGKRHKTSIDWIEQMVLVVRHWLPDRKLRLITDGGLISVRLGQRCNLRRVTFISRLHLNIRLFDAPSETEDKSKPVGKRQPNLDVRLADPETKWLRQKVEWYGGKKRVIEYITGTALWQTPSDLKNPLPIRWVLVRDPQGKFKSSAFCSTDLSLSAQAILKHYVSRWNIEVTFQECRAHLGFETQRQWNTLAIARITPLVLGLYSLVVLLALELSAHTPIPVRRTAWYTKTEVTFSDTLAFVRRYLWEHTKLANSPQNTRLVQLPVTVLDDLLQTVAYTT